LPIHGGNDSRRRRRRKHPRAAAAVDRLAFLVEPGLLVDLAVGVQVVDIACDFLACRILPRTLANPVVKS
jgi:hypothetical protein